MWNDPQAAETTASFISFISSVGSHFQRLTHPDLVLYAQQMAVLLWEPCQDINHRQVGNHSNIDTEFILVQLYLYNRKISGASLVMQWLRIRLPMQETRVRALVREDPTCHGATKPVRHNYWACVLEPASHSYWACLPQLLKPMHLEPMLRNKRSHRNEKPTHRNEE